MSHDVKVNSKKFAPFLAGLSFLLCAATSAPNYKDILASPDRPDLLASSYKPRRLHGHAERSEHRPP